MKKEKTPTNMYYHNNLKYLANFNKETLNNLNQKKIIILKSYNHLLNIIIISVKSNKHTQNNYALKAITNQTKRRIEKDLNENIFKNNQYTLIINEDSIRHVAEHFNKEEKMAIEILKTANTISNYDKVKLITEEGQKRLIFEKNIVMEILEPLKQLLKIITH